MSKHKDETLQWYECIAEMEAAIERLRKKIQDLKEDRNTLEQGNLDLYRQLTQGI